MLVACRPVSAGWHNVEMFGLPPVGRSSLYAYVSNCPPNLQCCRDMHVPSPLSVSYLPHEIFFETELTNSVSRIATCEFIIMVFASFLECARDEPCARWISASRTRARGTQVVLFPLLQRVLRLVNGKTFHRLIEIFSFDLVHNVLEFKRSQEVHWSDLSRFQWCPYSFSEGVLDAIKPFTVLAGKRGVDAEAVSSETLPEVPVLWLSDQMNFHLRTAEVLVSHHRGEISLPGAIIPGVPDSFDYYVDVESEANWNIADLNVSDQPLDHTILNP